MQDALNCIRCAACMNICPTYGVVGGHAFGYIYPGPIGIPWTASVHGLEKAGEFAHLCVSCGLCKEICPAEIDIPMMISAVKDRYSKLERHPLVNRALMAAESMAKMGSATAPVSNWFMNNQVFRSQMEKYVGIDRRRKLLPFRRKTLAKRFDTRGATLVSNPTHHVAFFADIYANYNAPDLGMAAVERLESAGCKVLMPLQQGCGYPYIGYGDLDQARKVAEENVKKLIKKHATDQRAIASISVWEFALRVTRGPINLKVDPNLWLDSAIKNSGLKVIELSPEIVLESCNLPGYFHRDPADQIIVATARIHNLTLLKKDRKILDYPHVNSLW